MKAILFICLAVVLAVSAADPEYVSVTDYKPEPPSKDAAAPAPVKKPTAADFVKPHFKPVPKPTPKPTRAPPTAAPTKPPPIEPEYKTEPPPATPVPPPCGVCKPTAAPTPVPANYVVAEVKDIDPKSKKTLTGPAADTTIVKADADVAPPVPHAAPTEGKQEARAVMGKSLIEEGSQVVTSIEDQLDSLMEETEELMDEDDY